MKIFNYIENAKKVSNAKSYNELAKKMGITKSALSQIRSGGTASEETILKIAILAKEDPIRVMSDYKIDRSKSAEEKEFWRSLLQIAAGVIFLVSGIYNSPVEANTEIHYKIQDNNLYIMRIVSGWIKRTCMMFFVLPFKLKKAL